MKRLELSGFEGSTPDSKKYRVEVLGNSRLFDPELVQGLPVFERISQVSQNGKWVVFRRSLDDLVRLSVLEVGQTKEVIIPMDSWSDSHVVGIMNDGSAVGVVDCLASDTFFKRPFICKYNDAPSLPPVEQPDVQTDVQNRKLSYKSVCLAQNGSIYGVCIGAYPTKALYWQEQKGVWQLNELPEFMDPKSLCPMDNGRYLYSKSPSRGKSTFAIYDHGKSEDLSLSIADTRALTFLGVGENGSIIGSFSKKNSNDASSDFFSFVANPKLSNEVLVLNPPNEYLWARKISSNGRFILSDCHKEKLFVLEQNEEGYHAHLVLTDDWRLEEQTDILDDGTIFCSGSCTNKQSDYYRLKLPLKLSPSS